MSTVGRVSQLDLDTRNRLLDGCNFINHEVSRLRKRVIWVFTLSVAIAIAWMIMVRRPSPFADLRWPIGFVFVVVGTVAALAQQQLSKNYKDIVVRRIVAAIGEGLTYNPESSLTKDEFLSMDLFNLRCEDWHSEDEVSGEKNTVAYSVHEAKATRTEGSGKSRRTVMIFKGLIVQLEFNKNFAGHTVVVPQREADILLGLFGESGSRRRKEIVHLENADFENLYSVYSTNDQEARYLLTPKMMELILHARSVLDSDIRLAFIDNSLFLTIPTSADRFEVSLFNERVTPETAAGDLVEVVGIAEKLVDVLDLETRIWTRV